MNALALETTGTSYSNSLADEGNPEAVQDTGKTIDTGSSWRGMFVNCVDYLFGLGSKKTSGAETNSSQQKNIKTRSVEATISQPGITDSATSDQPSMSQANEGVLFKDFRKAYLTSQDKASEADQFEDYIRQKYFEPCIREGRLSIRTTLFTNKRGKYNLEDSRPMTHLQEKFADHATSRQTTEH